MKPRCDVLVIGELLADLISAERVISLADARSFAMYQGGSPANFAVQLKKQGVTSQVIAAVGNDGIGKFLLEQVAQIGLSTDSIHVIEGFPTSLVLVGRSHDTPDFVAYRMADTQIFPIAHADIDEVKIVHSCAFALSKEPARQNILDAFKYASETGKIVSLDWNFAPQIWGKEDGKTILQQICNFRPMLKFSLDDVHRFAGEALSIEDAKVFISGYSTTLTVLTCGGQGVWYREQYGEWTFKKVVPIENMVDATGAGDSFWSGVVRSFLAGESVDQQIDNGLKIAAMKISGQL